MSEERTSPPRASMFEVLFVASVYLLSLTSLIGVLLLSIGAFTPRAVALGAALSAAASGWIIRKRAMNWRFGAQEVGVLLVLLLAVLFRSNPATFLNGGQDPGLYSAMSLHFARTGSLELKDTLLPDLADDKEISSYYLKRSMHRIAKRGPNSWVGNMLPGVYLTNLERNQWDFQFYALHPIWLAIGHWAFGLHGQAWVLVLFSTLTVLGVYCITRRITGGDGSALCAASLLAINPGHAYFATFPVSETVAGFFFLSSIYLLLEKRFLGFLVPLMALFLTRITGFITAPLLVLSLAWMGVRRRDPRPLVAGCGVLIAYAISFYWGLTFSPHYSVDIYKTKLGLGRSSLHYAWVLFLSLGVAWALFSYLVVRYHQGLRGAVGWLSRYRYAVSFAVVALLLAVCLAKGYLFAFTDHYQNHRWYSRRWRMAGHGWSSVRFLSLNTLRLLLSSVGMIGSFAGLIMVGAAACRRSTVAPIPLLMAGFSIVFLFGQLTTPITYYFSRYLVSEIVPLACICAAVALERVRLSLPKGGWYLFPLYGACVLYSVWTPIVSRMSATEGEGITRAVECLDQITGSNGVLLLDRQGLAFGAYAYATPLKLGFGKRIFTVVRNDFVGEPAKLDALVSYFERRNLEVFLVSSHTTWQGHSGLQRVLTLPITQRLLLAQRRLPSRFWKRSRTITVYAKRADLPMPGVCARMVQER